MKNEKKELILDGKKYVANVQIVENEDKNKLIEIYKIWDDYSTKLNSIGIRRANLSEVSELIFCLIYDCWRVNNVPKVKHSSFDCYNPKTQARIQIKSCSIKNDTTSFGPKSIWDELYFMDFYPNEKYDGSFNVYRIPDDYIYNCIVNKSKNETVRDQQNQKRRPRLSIKTKIIEPYKLKPIGQFNLFDL